MLHPQVPGRALNVRLDETCQRKMLCIGYIRSQVSIDASFLNFVLYRKILVPQTSGNRHLFHGLIIAKLV